MQSEELQTLAITALNDLQAINLITYDVRPLTSITDYMIICSGRSTRHVKSLAEAIVKKAKQQAVTYIKMEGERESEWVLVDLGAVIIHVMLPTAREFYNLEDLWEPIKTAREQQSR
ncbi:MAG: ribosome silencing factor [Gammaproteobacteria bacterium RIFCSPHIGHO2_12_FULL_41_20]|nr:MAG: ribosome silencing factor [Gammaproteobacteria bacterium RIFCSPHIGHO2_12_FULL_41_20]